VSDCRRKVEAAIRRHRALAKEPFPFGNCEQDDCPHDLIHTIMADNTVWTGE